MLRRLLREGGAERDFLEKLDIFQQNPGLLEKYMIGSEMSLEVLDLFLTRLFGSEGLSAVADAKEAVKSVLDPPPTKRNVCEKVTEGADEPWAVVEQLQQQVQDLTRQFSALQRQLQMQGNVSQVVTSITGGGAETPGSEHVSPATCTLGSLVDDVSRLKEAERKLDSRMTAVETRSAGSEWVLWAEIQHNIEIIDLKTDPLSGIIAHLTQQCGGNVYKEGIVNVTASGCFSPGSEPENVVDLGSDAHFCSNSAPDSWIRYDFKKWRMTPTSYSIRSYSGGPGYNHPKSWVLEVSNDGIDGSWEVVDTRENNKDLNNSLVTCNFEITAPPSGAFRFVRLRQTGKNHCGYDELEICAFELFGALCADERAPQRKV